jgi:hypothetical protein
VEYGCRGGLDGICGSCDCKVGRLEDCTRSHGRDDVAFCSSGCFRFILCLAAVKPSAASTLIGSLYGLMPYGDCKTGDDGVQTSPRSSRERRVARLAILKDGSSETQIVEVVEYTH